MGQVLEKMCLGAALAVTAAGLLVATVRPALWVRLSDEGTGAEAVTVLALLLFSGIAGLRASRARRGGRAALFGLLGLGLFAAGEEISWGQRLLGFEAPAFFAAHNVQGETNLHNLLRPPYDLLLAGVLLVAFVAAPAVRPRPELRALVRRGLPWPSWYHVGLAIGCFFPIGVLAATGTRGLEELAELVAVLVAAAVVSHRTPRVAPQLGPGWERKKAGGRTLRPGVSS